MYKYKIMIIDDEIKNRIGYLLPFFSNEALWSAKTTSDSSYQERIPIEFEVIYPDIYEILDTYIYHNRVDAYFLDVYLDKDTEWTLDKALSAICKYNPKAPIFMYSLDWKDKDVITTVAKAFRDSFPGKTATYYYELNYINDIVTRFRNVENIGQMNEIGRERRFIKDMITKAYGKTAKEPFQKNGDIVILHVSDLHYGSEDFTEYSSSLWHEIIKTTKNLKKDGIDGVDLLAITGDVSMHGKADEMRAAKNELEQYLFKNLWRDEYADKAYADRILMVPGNHDFDLNFCTLDYLVSENGINEDARKINFVKASESLKKIGDKINDYHVMGLTAYKDFAYGITNNPIYYQKKNLNFIEKKFTSWNLRFLCLNTCDGINSFQTNGVSINEDDLKTIFNEIDDEECCTIVLSHHSPLYDNKLNETEVHDFHKNCTSIICSCNPIIWLSGHQHVQKTDVSSTDFSNMMIYEAPTLCLTEKWVDNKEYEVKTVDGKSINGCRGFEFIILRKQPDGNYQPDLIKYAFDKKGVAHRILLR